MKYRSYGLLDYQLPEFVAEVSVEPSSRDVKVLARFAVETAIEAASAIIQQRNELGDLREYSQTKSSSVDPVTVVDSLAEDIISERIAAHREGDGIIAEEGTFAASVSGVTWVVDPIDGTVNFIYGNPNFAVSIGAAIDGEVVAGAVINVATGDLFVAARGHGAYRASACGQIARLEANSETRLSQCLVATGFSYSATRRAQQAEILGTLLPAVRDIRRLGSAALDLCALAQGMVDCYYEHGLNSWDYAAGCIIAREAGAHVVAPALSVSGEEGQMIWASAPGVAGQFGQLMSDFYGPLGR